MGRSPSCDGKVPVKKGPWTPEEDRVLVDYIQRHGSNSNWRRIPKLAGLNRCSKSCRLRWTNYLHPDIKHGPFTDKEEKTIIHLHSILGNKWSTIAIHLPGRTDNVIKNYWNTNLRKKLLDMDIDPDTHRPRTDLSLLTGLPSLPAPAPSNSFSSGVSMGPGAWDMDTPQLHADAPSFTGSYSSMNAPRRFQDETASFTGSYSGAGWDMNSLYRLQADTTKFQLLQGDCWVISASLGSMRALVGKLDTLLLAPSSQKFSSKRVKGGMHLLKDDVEEISSYLDELSEVEDPPPVAMCWMNEARELSYDMEDYIDSLLFGPPDHFNKNKKKNKKKKKKKRMMIKKRLKWYRQITYTQVSEHDIKASKCIHVSVVPRLLKKPKIVETISEFRIYVQEAIERHDRYKLHYCSNLRRRPFLSTVRMLPVPYEETDDHIVIDGRMNEFINSLAANDAVDQKQLKVVSVLGSGCLGKTTLAKVLYNRIGMQVDCKAFIRVSKKPDMKRLLHDLFSQLHRKKQPRPANCNELGISKHLQDKRYLIVIDDLWDAPVWDIVKYAFPKGNRGSRIIITTQIEDVALTCCCDHPEHVFEMKPLDDDHSRKLFFNSLFGSESDCPEEFKQVSNEIVDICGGLPLATINIASHLANQETQVSMDLLAYARDSLRSCLWSNSTSERTKQVLNLSYNNLPRHLKTCLLYLHMYPEGSIIWKDDLVRQWVAEAFIGTRKGKEQDQNWMEKAAGIYFDELIDRRFIQPLYINYNNKVLSCTVHDVVRDLIAHKSAEENFIVVVDHNRKNIALSHKVRRLSLVFGDAKYAKTPANITKSQVRSLRFFGLFECMPCIREFKLLRVLSLQLFGHAGDDDGPVDLTGISEMFQLRYLKIAGDVCIKLPNHVLHCLEILDIADARVACVPRGIHLPNLLHLGLPVDKNLPDWIHSGMSLSLERVHKLHALQDLHLTRSSTLSSDHLNRSMDSILSLLEGHGNLKTIVVAHGSSAKSARGTSDVTLSWDLLAPPLLQRFEFSPHSRIIFSRIPLWIEKHGNLRILKITVGELHMSCVDILRGSPALTALSLYVEKAPYDKIIFDKVGFSVLKYFKLRFTSGIAWIKFEEGAMPNLWKLKLVFDDIPSFKKDSFALISVEHMPGLKEISTKFGGEAADLEYALRTLVSNHPSNPIINMPSDKTMGKEHPQRNLEQESDEILKEEEPYSNLEQESDKILEEQEPDEYGERLERRPADKRISRSPDSSSRLHVPAVSLDVMDYDVTDTASWHAEATDAFILREVSQDLTVGLLQGRQYYTGGSTPEESSSPVCTGNGASASAVSLDVMDYNVTDTVSSHAEATDAFIPRQESQDFTVCGSAPAATSTRRDRDDGVPRNSRREARSSAMEDAEENSMFETSHVLGALLASSPLLARAWDRCVAAAAAATGAASSGFVHGDGCGDGGTVYVAFSGLQAALSVADPAVASGADVFAPVGLGGDAAGARAFPQLAATEPDAAATGERVAVQALALRCFLKLCGSPEFQMLLNQIRGKAVVFTGHSLGGVIAALAALHYLCISSLSSPCSPTTPVLCVTFGSPLLGNEALSRAIMRERWGGNFCNVVSQHDVVPRLLFCPLDAVPVRVIIGMQLQQWPGHTHNTGVMTTHVVDAEQEGLRQLIQAHVRTVAMEQKLVDPESRGGSPYRPFGAYVLCSPEGAVCVDNSTAAVQMLYATFAACYARGDTTSLDLEAAHSCYGDLVLKMPQNLLLKRRLHAMDVLASMSSSNYDVGISLAMEASKRAGRSQGLNCAELATRLGRITSCRVQVQLYKASFDGEMGYYDAFKQRRSPKKFNKVDMCRIKLSQFWDGVLTMLDNSQLPHDFHRRAKWVNATRFYQLLVEPLDIADFHRKNLHKTRGHYITHGRDRRYELFDKWWKEKGAFTGTSTGDASVTATARGKYARLTQDPCFWARVEEAWDQTESALAEHDVAMLAVKLGRLREFERYARELVESKEVSIDVLAPQSSYTRWVEEWKKLLLRDEPRTASLF